MAQKQNYATSHPPCSQKATQSAYCTNCKMWDELFHCNQPSVTFSAKGFLIVEVLYVQLEEVRAQEARAQEALQAATEQVQQVVGQLEEADEKLQAERELQATLAAEASVKSSRLARLEGARPFQDLGWGYHMMGDFEAGGGRGGERLHISFCKLIGVLGWSPPLDDCRIVGTLGEPFCPSTTLQGACNDVFCVSNITAQPDV